MCLSSFIVTGPCPRTWGVYTCPNRVCKRCARHAAIYRRSRRWLCKKTNRRESVNTLLGCNRHSADTHRGQYPADARAQVLARIQLHQSTQKETEMQMYMIAPAIGMTVYAALIATVLVGG